MSETEGPKLTVHADCFPCVYSRPEHYVAQGDSGHNVHCDHPKSGGKRIGDSTWQTPGWCPLYHVQLERLLAKLTPATEGDDG